MGLIKTFFRIFLFSILQTVALPFGLLPYGFFILPYAFIAAFLIFFAPIFISATTMYLAFPEIPRQKKHKIFGKLTAAVSFAIAAKLIYTQRGSGEYFGNQTATYIQLGFASFIGYWVWIFLAGIFFSEEDDPQSIDTLHRTRERIKFSKLSIFISNLILGNLIVLFSTSDINLYSRLPICFAYSVASLLIIFLLLRSVGTSKVKNCALGVLATILVPLVGTIFYDFDILVGLFSGLVGIVIFAPYWFPMAILNGFLFIRYKNSIVEF